MTLRQRQSKFAEMVVDLLVYLLQNGYEFTFGHAFRCKDCHTGIAKSLHKDKLAIDINLFKDGEYMAKTEDHLLLGEFWEKMGGKWGGRFKNSDGNHYEYGEDIASGHKDVLNLKKGREL